MVNNIRHNHIISSPLKQLPERAPIWHFFNQTIYNNILNEAKKATNEGKLSLIQIREEALHQLRLFYLKKGPPKVVNLLSSYNKKEVKHSYWYNGWMEPRSGAQIDAEMLKTPVYKEIYQSLTSEIQNYYLKKNEPKYYQYEYINPVNKL